MASMLGVCERCGKVHGTESNFRYWISAMCEGTHDCKVCSLHETCVMVCEADEARCVECLLRFKCATSEHDISEQEVTISQFKKWRRWYYNNG
jgi:hypothetical protein